MNTLFQLISHEYRKYVFTRGFLLFLLIIPVSAAFGYFASTISEKAAPTRSFMLIDETGQYVDVIDAALVESSALRQLRIWDEYALNAVVPNEDGSFPLQPPFAPAAQDTARAEAFMAAGGIEAATEAAKPYLIEGAQPIPEIRDRFVRVDLPADIENATGEARDDLIREYVRGDKTLAGQSRNVFAGIVIPADFAQGGVVRFYTNNLIDGELRSFIDRALTNAIKAYAYEQQGVDAAMVRQIESIAIPVVLYKASTEDGTEAGGTEFAESIIPLVLAYALFIMVMSIGGMLLTSTVEEKSNKIVEVLLSSVSAGQLMWSKLIGLALVGMTVPAIFLTAGFIATQVLGAQVAPGSDAEATIEVIRTALFESNLIPLFFGYFLIGYLMFASIYLAVGAMSNTIQDAQSFVGPLTIMLILPAPFLQMVVQDPNGLIARALTWIPLYAPYAIMIRMSAEPPQWEIIGATATLIAFVILVVTMMGRIYRNGVLSAGGAPSLKQARALTKSS